ncbi:MULTISPECIES: HNH endonuclease family protein [Bacillaceae]|uniref:HNH endonuclease n=1 Tax=Bacillaceae TaxID=186817 RepID=UPI00155FAFBD|nr:HNH endonuclease [Niallia circulans]NRG28118.1 HNH endonuclease [Niallia circulans]
MSKTIEQNVMFDHSHLEPELKNKSKNGGYTRDGYGAICVRKPNHPYNNSGYVRLHRLVMELHLQRYLEPNESVIALDGNYENTNIENLKLVRRNGLDDKRISYYTKNRRRRMNKTYVYRYPEGDLFGVVKEMIGYDYELASLNDLIKQKWCDRRAFGRAFVVKDGTFLYEGSQFKPFNG